MARPLRLEFAGALYHVTSRGDRREDIYLTDSDRKAFIGLLGEVCEQFNWRVQAYCLMSNHYHLLLETVEGNLAAGMRQLNGVYTQDFNRAHGRVGHVFQGRYKAILVDSDCYLLELARYVVLNPVRAGMVGEVVEWPWSSYRAMLGELAPGWLAVDSLLACFGPETHPARESYCRFVQEGLNRASPWMYLRGQIFLGSDAFVEAMQARISTQQDSRSLREIPKAQHRAPAQPLAWYASNYADRNQAIREAYRTGSYTMEAIAAHFGLHYSSISRIVSS